MERERERNKERICTLNHKNKSHLNYNYLRLSSLNNDIDLKELDINRLKKKNQDLEDENNMISVEKENLK